MRRLKIFSWLGFFSLILWLNLVTVYANKCKEMWPMLQMWRNKKGTDLESEGRGPCSWQNDSIHISFQLLATTTKIIFPNPVSGQSTFQKISNAHLSEIFPDGIIEAALTIFIGSISITDLIPQPSLTRIIGPLYTCSSIGPHRHVFWT